MRLSSTVLLVAIISLGVGTRSARAQAGGVDATIQVAAEAYLTEHFPADARRLEVRVQRTSPDLAALDQYTVRFPSEGALPRAATQVTLYSQSQNGSTDKVGWAMLYIAQYDSVVVSHARIAPDDVIRPEDVTIAWIETTRSYGEPLRASDLRAALTTGPVYARRLIRDGDVLRASDVRPAYAADTGSPVVVTYARGRIVLKLNCTAREPGSVGDVIRVYCPDTGATYRARLTNAGTADWTSTL